ncbi:Axl2p KNAG_0E01650 [Huiozyma naganishii CBS 8797]|uniref:Dystroglycan-type cadherin-like domain-containing protein n=1 Tax=Huiozyma naganishii (strain ATCC MYA-139 / BCRC 22969 / CBS 8797 / KCTC 17520 / NBRC 10181 / NCYC 3082 / Yp74L-3) TaxID=1071383 RepID=J7RZ06_HUIN7|nr:hypothetical protein KNAG_0E01650 [Kazachstania naganishii CBS 8797]CCK70427.1 hypothetical protein KNAG_0E01650 [Kazachstania naganishii CBS 8797]
MRLNCNNIAHSYKYTSSIGMLIRLPLLFFLLVQAKLISFARAAPYEAYPIGKQFPPIARVNEAFNFQISNDTYKSNADTASQISYTAHSLPDWLSFSGDSRTFSGVPPSSVLDNGESVPYYFNIVLEGTDPVDNIALNETYQLVVSQSSELSLNAENFDLLKFLAQYGNTNGKDGLVVSQGENVDISFKTDFFNNYDQIKQFAGRTALYNAPLPNWIFFDPTNLEFNGRTPYVNSQIAPEIYYDMVLIATEIEGFSSLVIPFNIVLGAHQLTTSLANKTISLEADSNGNFNYSVPMDTVYLDGSPIKSEDIGSVFIVNNPTWVQLANETEITGQVSENDDSDSKIFALAIADKYGDVVYLNFNVNSTSVNIFSSSSLPDVNATRNEWFQYKIPDSIFTNVSATNVSVTFSGNSWLNYQSDNLTFIGSVPEDFDSIQIDVIGKERSISQTLNFTIRGIDGNTTTHHNHTSSLNHTISSHSQTSSYHNSSSVSSIRSSSSSTVSSSSSSSSSSSLASTSTSAFGQPLNLQNKSKGASNKKTVAIACGVAIPVVVIIVCLVIFLLFWRRRRGGDANMKDFNDTEKMPHAISKPDINNPANKPNQMPVTSLENPFDDGSNKSDGKSLGSETDSSFDGQEKQNSALSLNEGMLPSVNMSSSREHLLEETKDNRKKSQLIDPFNRTSSFYMDTAPASRQSWRHNPEYHGSDNLGRSNRASMASLNTVSTEELMNTKLKTDEHIPKDPRKSSLGLRDSVFWTNPPNSDSSNNMKTTSYPKGSLNTVVELPQTNQYGMSTSSSSSDDFVPVKEGEEYNWVHRHPNEQAATGAENTDNNNDNKLNGGNGNGNGNTVPMRKPSNKRFVRLSTGSGVNIGNVIDVEGHVPELI